jgi:hypothetical protein
MDQPTQEAIRVRVYFLWLEAGCPEWQEVLHWLQAEAEAEFGLYPAVDENELPQELSGDQS